MGNFAELAEKNWLTGEYTWWGKDRKIQREGKREREREKEGMRETTICIFRVAVLWQDGGDDAEDDEPHGLHAGKDFLQ